MPLTATGIKNAGAAEKPLKIFDGGGMFLVINSNGSRWWRLQYRYLGNEKQLSLGTYPEVSLKGARDRRGAQATRNRH